MNLAFDPFDPAQTQNQWETLRELRRSAPVSRPRSGFVYVARYHDVKAVFRDTASFSNREGFRGAGVVLPLEESFLGEIDPPLHTDLRVLMLQAFKPGLERRAVPFTRSFTEGLLRDVIDTSGGDLIERVALRIPAAVTLHVLGIPSSDIAQVSGWGFALLHSTWPETNATSRGVGLGGAFPELASLSTTNLIGNLLYRFMRDPDFERALRADRSLLPRAGERVILGIASGNRDESVYSESDAFLPERWPGAPEPLSFGPGPHLCLGNQLARMEARVALETLMDLLPARALQLAPGHSLELVPMFLEYGPERLDANVAL